MPITPIEIAAMAPKSQEASLYKHQESQKPLNEQIVIGQQFNNHIKQNNQQTVGTIKSENKEYRYDAKEKGNNSYSGSKQNKKKNNNKGAAPKDNFRSGSIDIKI
ncbi:hypothetical protein Ana3638_15995 [Anaerocolumna sedimenticola]|uniref:Uncharacterized protein n=1 Tax=Anaerocolumna sedimenticola TaxID=2696063 RepID=A0A6P1TQC8_9FIRM|nr:hypothetical protein [Anaerocolumna sedimenticola]QHQ62101.1 hypothetical protein Ana3638_15995 [Anaerocolumna sedimenticola]